MGLQGSRSTQLEGRGRGATDDKSVGFVSTSSTSHIRSKAPTVFSAFSEAPDSFIGPTPSSIGGLVKLLSNAKESIAGGARAATRTLSNRGDHRAQVVEYRPRHTSWEVQPDKQSLWYNDDFLIFNPDSWMYALWWHLGLFFAYCNLFQVPFSLGFVDVHPPLIDVIVWAVDTFFLLDVFVNFCTPIKAKGRLVQSRSEIALAYLAGHFWIDVCAAIPFDRIAETVAPSNPYIQVLAFNRLLRARRLFILQTKLQKSVSINYDAVIILKLLTMVAALAHMEACLFWFVGDVQGQAGWMHVLGVAEAVGNDPWRQYLTSLYWAVTTFTTVGYGDLRPTNDAEETLAMISMVINMGMTAYVIGNITILTTEVDQKTLEFRAKVSEVDSYLATKHIPADLRDMAVRQLETHQELLGETDEALQHCPPYIRNRILSHLYFEKLFLCPLLRGTSANFVNAIAHAAILNIFQADTLLGSAGERAYNWIVVLSGALVVKDGSVSRCNSTTFRTIRKGNTFGAAGVFCNMRQDYAIRTKVLSRVLVVPYSSLKTICEKYRPDHRRVCENFCARLESLKPSHEADRLQIQETLSSVRSHVLSLKADFVSDLCQAAAMGDLAQLKALLQSDRTHDINEGDYSGRRPLHMAASAGNITMMKYLVTEEKADVNVRDAYGFSPLHDAVAHMRPAAATVLREYGARLMLRNTGSTLCGLVASQRYEALKLHLENGADPNCGDYDMRTSLHIACADGQLAVVKLLFRFRADPAVRDRYGVTPLEEAKEHPAVARFLVQGKGISESGFDDWTSVENVAVAQRTETIVDDFICSDPFDIRTTLDL